MGEAIFGLIGVIVGGLITAGTQLWNERLRNRNEFQRAKRLIESELLNAEYFMDTLVKTAEFAPYPNVDDVLPTSAWREYAPAVVSSLDDKLWKRLVMTYGNLEHVKAMMTSNTPDMLTPDKWVDLRGGLAGQAQWLKRNREELASVALPSAWRKGKAMARTEP